MNGQPRRVRRESFLSQLAHALRAAPVVAILGPRQCGKTTLVRDYLGQVADATYFDLEDPLHEARLENPQLVLSALQGLVVIDEIQHKPELFQLLRVLADREGSPAQFLILGSASPDLVRNASESLAGRVRFLDLGGFDATEVGFDNWQRLWLRGGFPRSFLSGNEAESLNWRSDFIRTFLTRDIPQLGITIPAQQLRRFWTMVAHYHGQMWNASEIAGSLAVNYKTAQRYLDILTGAFMVRQLQAWTENRGKRVRKAPKLYLRDSGLVHSLLGIEALDQLQSHPKLGASWEGFALEHVTRMLGIGDSEAYFWATHGGAEVDLFFIKGGRRYGFELKYGDAPRSTKSMHIAIDDLSLDELFVIYPGSTDYPLAERIRVVGFENLAQLCGEPQKTVLLR